MAFADVAANLRLNISDFSSKLTTASKQMSGFAKNMNKQYGDASKALTKHNFDLKDTARIVQGILVAQTFYTGARAIREATSALWDFNKSLDYAHVTYSALFGDTQLASNFMNVLKEHSIETIFDYQNLADASKKLLAYGIEYENLMFIMEGLTNLGAMSGDTAALDRISLALGQIYTRGKLTAEEMRQLANAYVPISDIIKEKFNLTPDEMGKVGNLNLPAGEVINAIVDYANERFASVGDAAMYTITGLQNKIVDTIKVIGVEMLGPLTTAYKSFLAYVANGLEAVREEFSAHGVGGIFEYLVPDPNTQQMIRQFMANVHNLFMSLASVGVVVGKVFGNFAHVIVSAFNIIMPVITTFINVLSAMLNAMLSTRTGAAILRVALLGAAAAFVVLRVHALAALVITTVTKAVMGLAKALLILSTLITRHPIIALLTGLAIALVGVSTASGNANSGLNKLFDTISGAGGVSSGDVLQKVEKDIEGSSNALDDFNNRFEEGAGAADDLADGIGGVGKAADKAKKKAGLLSFDEVFKLNDPSSAANGSGAGAGIGDAIENLAAGLGSLGGALIPEIPDFSEFVDGFTDNLFGGLEDGIIKKLKTTGIGALIGAGIGTVIGGLLGGPAGIALGAKIGAFAGGLVGWFWEEITKHFSLHDSSGASLTIGAGIGAMLGFVLGGPAGALIGAGIGALAKDLIDRLWLKIGEVVGADQGSIKRAGVASTIGTGIGAIFGMILGGPAGAVIGAAIGAFAGGLGGLFWDKIKEVLTNPDVAIGAAIGASVGAFFGPVGAAIGAVVGGVIGNFWNDIAAGFDAWWADLSAGFGAWWADVTLRWNTWCAETSASLNLWWEGVKTDWSTFWTDIYTGLSTWWETTKLNWITKYTEIKTNLTTWWSGVKTDFAIKQAEILAALGTWWSNTKTNWSTRYASIKTDIGTWWEGIKTDYHTKQEEIMGSLSTWWDNTKTNWSTKYGEIKSDLTAWWAGVQEDLGINFGQMLTTTVTKLAGVKSEWSNKWNDIKTEFGTWWKNLKTDMGNWLEDYVWKPIADFFSLENFWNRIKGLLDAIKQKVSSWWSSVTSIFSSGGSSSFTVTTKSSGSGSTTKYASADDDPGVLGSSASKKLSGHAKGGIFNREHIARFAEGNKAEMAIPLENASAMQPFVSAISDGILQGLMPVMLSSNSNQNNLPPLYVGTLIADDRGIKQLYKKFEIIEAQEAARKGFA